MIATIDIHNKKLKLTSIMRDSYVNIDGHGLDKINHAYAFGKAPLAIKTLNENFDLNIEDFVAVNFSYLPKIIDKIGGIELDIDSEELEYINGYIFDKEVTVEQLHNYIFEDQIHGNWKIIGPSGTRKLVPGGPKFYVILKLYKILLKFLVKKIH